MVFERSCRDELNLIVARAQPNHIEGTALVCGRQVIATSSGTTTKGLFPVWFTMVGLLPLDVLLYFTTSVSQLGIRDRNVEVEPISA